MSFIQWLDQMQIAPKNSSGLVFAQGNEPANLIVKSESLSCWLCIYKINLTLNNKCLYFIRKFPRTYTEFSLPPPPPPTNLISREYFIILLYFLFYTVFHWLNCCYPRNIYIYISRLIFFFPLSFSHFSLVLLCIPFIKYQAKEFQFNTSVNYMFWFVLTFISHSMG